jgi:hypothetical protein
MALTVIAKIQNGKLYKIAQMGQSDAGLPFVQTGLPSVDERRNTDFGQFNHTPDQYLADWQKVVHENTLEDMKRGQPGRQKEMVQYFQGKVGEIDNYIKNNPNLTPEQLNRLRSEKYNLMTHAEAYRRNIGMGGGADLNKYYNSYMQNQQSPQPSSPVTGSQNAMVSQIMTALTSPRSWGEYQAPSRMSEQEVFNLVKSRMGNMGNNEMISKLAPGQTPPQGR